MEHEPVDPDLGSMGSIAVELCLDHPDQDHRTGRKIPSRKHSDTAVTCVTDGDQFVVVTLFHRYTGHGKTGRGPDWIFSFTLHVSFKTDNCLYRVRATGRRRHEGGRREQKAHVGWSPSHFLTEWAPSRTLTPAEFLRSSDCIHPNGVALLAIRDPLSAHRDYYLP